MATEESSQNPREGCGRPVGKNRRQGLEIQVGVQGEPLVFDLVPEMFDQVEFRARGGKKLHIEVVFLPALKLVLAVFTGMDRRVVDDD